MNDVPRVVGITAQKSTSSRPSKALAAKTITRLTYAGERQRIVFVNLLGESVEVLAGAGGAPTVTDGYAKWLHIPRPQRNAVTILEGFEPTTLSVPITFSAAKMGGAAQVERAIETLETMAGLHANKEYDPDIQLLSVYTADGKGMQIPLLPQVPREVIEKGNTYWVISGIEWDTKPEREPAGYRIRQDATVTLTEWSPAPGGREPVEALRSRLAKEKPTTILTSASINTIKRIAAYYHKPYQQAWQEILAANRGNKVIGTNPSKHLPVGTKVKVPAVIAKSGLR